MSIVVIVGLGALGSHVILSGRNIETDWVGIDFDRIEQKNVLSQFHTRMTLNRNKAQAVQQTMRGLFGLNNFRAIPNRLTKDNVDVLLKNADLVVDCLDNAASRRVIQEYARKNNIPCLHGALAANGAFGRVIWDENFVIDQETGEGATCEDGEHLPFIMMVSTLISSSIKDFLSAGKRKQFHIFPDGVMKV